MKSSKAISKSFFGFLLASFLIWVLTTFSKEYKTTIAYEVAFKNISEKNMLLENAPKQISLYVAGSGFRLFWSQIFNKKIVLDASKFGKNSELKTYILPKNQFTSIQNQLLSGVAIENIVKDTLFVDIGFLQAKKVAVKPNLNINFQIGYNLLGDIKITPDSVIIFGTKNQLKQIHFLETDPVKLKNINADFSKNLTILKPAKFKNIKLSNAKSKVYAKVDKFTEGKLKVPFKIKNLPSNIKITTLSESVMVTFVVGLSNFSKVTQDSFLIECDFELSEKNDLNYLIPKLIIKPDFVENIKIIPTKIDFLIQN